MLTKCCFSIFLLTVKACAPGSQRCLLSLRQLCPGRGHLAFPSHPSRWPASGSSSLTTGHSHNVPLLLEILKLLSLGCSLALYRCLSHLLRTQKDPYEVSSVGPIMEGQREGRPGHTGVPCKIHVRLREQQTQAQDSGPESNPSLIPTMYLCFSLPQITFKYISHPLGVLHCPSSVKPEAHGFIRL